MLLSCKLLYCTHFNFLRILQFLFDTLRAVLGPPPALPYTIVYPGSRCYLFLYTDRQVQMKKKTHIH